MNEPPPQLAEVTLEPLVVGRLRRWEGTEAWETFRGKVNRVSIGLPRWEPNVDGDRSVALGGDGSLSATARMTVDLTLRPDVGCRFANAELGVRLEPDAGAGDAVVASLRPSELADQAVVVREVGGSIQASMTPAVDAGLNLSRSARQEVTRTLVRLAAFGVGTPEAGWRLSLTDARDIPLSTLDLTSMIAHPGGWRGTVHFSVLAQLQVLSRTDRWLTAAFGMGDTARLECRQAFPTF